MPGFAPSVEILEGSDLVTLANGDYSNTLHSRENLTFTKDVYKRQALQTKDLCKTYIVNKRQNNVLKNVDLTVEEGEMVAVMGPSGSGKSTLLYAGSGMDRITAGSVSFFGRELAGMRPRELADTRLEEMGFIFQQMYMLKNLTVLDNIILPACQSKEQRAPRREIVARGEGLMRKLGIVETADSDISEVSGGQLQRACICRSLINRPKMIFADEPTGALNRAASDLSLIHI